MNSECAALVEKTLMQTEMGFKEDVSDVKLDLYKELKAAAKGSLALFGELAMIV